MSSDSISAPVDEQTIETAWETFTSEEEVYRSVKNDILDTVTDACASGINAGNYDATASMQNVFEAFVDEHCADDAPFVTDVLESDALIVEVLERGHEQVAQIIFQQLIEELVDNGDLLYVYNRQQVRSHVAEMARYFALIRQRLSSDTDYSFSPNLVKMVKIASADREQPIMGKNREKARRFQQPLRRINEQIEDAEPAWEFEDSLGSDWRMAVSDTLELMGEFFQTGLPEEFDSLAAYQARAFENVFVDSVTQGGSEARDANVVTASTGGGKTEAFLFPTLAYSLLANEAGIDGTKAVLTYPRRDLCNNQFERLFSYITTINELQGSIDASFSDAPLTLSIQHGGRGDVELPCPHCDDEVDGTLERKDDAHFECQQDSDHVVRYATTDRGASADFLITTGDSLHRRLMDKYGNAALWSEPYPPKFLVLDEVHVYTDQAGMNVANVVRRFKQAMQRRARNQEPRFIASSATINNATEFTGRIFGIEESSVRHLSPSEDEKDTLGREHFVFVKATDPREVIVPVGDSQFKPRSEWTETAPTTATNLSCMIQIAFAFYHTMRKEQAGDRPGLTDNKDRILGFVDSIDSVSRLGGFVQETEEEGLFRLRTPDAVLGERGNNPDCPREQFRGATDDTFDEGAVCESLPPNPNLNACPVYEDGECWWTMQDRRLDLQAMEVAIHKSGRTQHAGTGATVEDDWDQLISTSALEVGFDHPSIIGTFQYRAPRNVPGFVQRKGRGGRDAEDEPITVVVLGSSPTDSYYFHHSNYLSDPRDEHLDIPLDADNRFVRAEHMTAAIVDYFNVTDTTDAKRLFRGQWTSGPGVGPDVPYLRDQFEAHEPDIRDWLDSAFEASAEEIDRVLQEFDQYVVSLFEEVAPGTDDTPYWEFFERAMDNRQTTGPIDQLIDALREEEIE
ncbi:helicase-like protein [Natrinema hispanicum]|uniref:Helicase-like protein n=1 Tax=Natrinema hispanicum TaxID=392421 RepID=A0A482Y2Y9_9EURY|nr:DEAD/DEAH box helicase [Natrinema hispanicum]RZV05164.1 helicase-like protein [Natrinema hispanicum]